MFHNKLYQMQNEQYNPFHGSALTTILVVSDIDKSKSFYVDVLGAYLLREYGGDSLVLEFLGNWIRLVKADGSTEVKPNTHFLTPDDKNSVSVMHTPFG